MFTTLATDVDDPVERLHRISRRRRARQGREPTLGARCSPTGSSSRPPAPGPSCTRLRPHPGGAFPPGRRSTRSSRTSRAARAVKIGGAQLADMFSVGPMVEGIGLNVTVWSYVDRMNFSLLACPDLLPDVEVLASLFPAALAELRASPKPGAAAEPVPTPSTNGRQETARRTGASAGTGRASCTAARVSGTRPCRPAPASDGATPDVPVPPAGRAVDLPGRGSTHVARPAGSDAGRADRDAHARDRAHRDR